MATREFKIGNMDCAGCAREVEAAVMRLEGVEYARVEYFTNTLEVVGDVDFARLKERVEAVGKTVSDSEPDADESFRSGRAGMLGFWDFMRGRPDSRPALVGGALLLIALAADALQLLPLDISNLFYVLAMLAAMKPIAASGINSLRFNREFNINMLMTIAAIGALVLGEFLEAATVIFLFAIGEALEGYTADRARHSLRSLVALTPATARRLDGDQSAVVKVEALRIADRIRVLPGERIPMDGAVIAGTSAVDQAHITGESLPLAKAPGDEVFAGSINGEATLDIRVSRLSADNTLSRIIQMLQESQSRRAPSQRLIDRFAHVFTPAVALAAIAVAVMPPLLLGGNFWGGPDGSGWLYRALSMLVIACPCALVISTPVTVISAITSLARRGVLIKGGAALEALAGTRVIAFDKTGTLTRGRLQVMATHTDNCADGAGCAPCAELISLAAAVEAQSAHPFAEAILQAASKQGVAYRDASGVEALAGLGVRGEVDGRRVTIGSHRYFDDAFEHSDHMCALAAGIEDSGQSAVMVHDGDAVRGVIALSDAPRDESPAVVRALGAIGIESVMLSGDNRRAAESIAAQVGVDRFYGELLPQDKVAAVETLAAARGQVTMVGDGINDTPALARATVGVAMGGAGSAQAMEAADIVLMADGLRQLPATIERARFARRLIRENIALSFGLKAAFLLLAVTGNVTMLAAVFADMGMSLAVTLNGMRALRK